MTEHTHSLKFYNQPDELIDEFFDRISYRNPGLEDNFDLYDVDDPRHPLLEVTEMVISFDTQENLERFRTSKANVRTYLMFSNNPDTMTNSLSEMSGPTAPQG